MNTKKKKENNINIKEIWKLFRSEKGKRYSFIIFYFFFFIFLFIFLNTNSVITKENKEELSLPFSTKLLENNNYDFNYIINSNSNELLYKGIKINNTISLIDDTGTYLFNYKNGKYICSKDNNILHTELLDIYDIKRIIKNSKLISETKLTNEDKYIYNYEITNKEYSNITNIDNYLDLKNEIIVKTNSKKELESISLDLINYEKQINNNLDSFKIIIEYGDLNE